MDLQWVVIIILVLLGLSIVARLLSLPLAVFFSVVVVGVLISLVTYVACLSLLSLLGLPVDIINIIANISVILIMTYAIVRGVRRQKIVNARRRQT